MAATTLAQVAKEESTAEEPWRRGRGGTSLGWAVHAVLQTVDLETGAGLAAAEKEPGLLGFGVVVVETDRAVI